MQSWESFTKRYPRLRLSSFLRRKGVKSFDEAVSHFRAMGVEPSEEALRKIYGFDGFDVKVEAVSGVKSPESEPTMQQADETSESIVNESTAEAPEAAEDDGAVQAPKTTRRRTSRRKNTKPEAPE